MHAPTSHVRNLVGDPVMIVPPAGASAPLVVDSPHSGMEWPAGFTPAAPREAILTAWDAWLDERSGSVPVHGAGVIRALDLGVVPPVAMIVLLTASIDLVMGSSSAKWAMLGPILVPLFMLLGYTPELTQTSYRVGDSITNIITPLSSNFPLVLMFLQRYAPRAGIGTLTATMLPHSVANLVCWTLLLVAGVLAGLPTGPGAPLLLAR